MPVGTPGMGSFSGSTQLQLEQRQRRDHQLRSLRRSAGILALDATNIEGARRPFVLYWVAIGYVPGDDPVRRTDLLLTTVARTSSRRVQPGGPPWTGGCGSHRSF
jgi:hypothetical protein